MRARRSAGVTRCASVRASSCCCDATQVRLLSVDGLSLLLLLTLLFVLAVVRAQGGRRRLSLEPFVRAWAMAGSLIASIRS